MAHEKYKHGNLCEKYDMTGVIQVGSGKLMVHDIFDNTPDFMLGADIVFVDPPANQAMLSGYYTKAEIDAKPKYDAFQGRLFDVIAEINPKLLVMELFESTKKKYLPELEKRYEHVYVVESMYYHNKKNKCYMAFASSNPDVVDHSELFGMDEEDIIAYICQYFDFELIADPCMGKGLVAYYANKYGRHFAGTELNKYRLAVAVERVSTNSRGKVN